jgi:predicted MFS family arabinose efflux permease
MFIILIFLLLFFCISPEIYLFIFVFILFLNSLIIFIYFLFCWIARCLSEGQDSLLAWCEAKGNRRVVDDSVSG